LSYLDLKTKNFINKKLKNGAKDTQINQDILYPNPDETNFCIKVEIIIIVEK
tara:strand:- start:3824 stop:3979 length:156 start_codon:yes stop_codon:yes gene_type:complete